MTITPQFILSESIYNLVTVVDSVYVCLWRNVNCVCRGTGYGQARQGGYSQPAVLFDDPMFNERQNPYFKYVLHPNTTQLIT
jgi:hypothetical protein